MKIKFIILAIPALLLTGLFLFISSCGDEEDPTPPEPDPVATSISLVSGGGQASNVETSLSGPVEVLVKDQDGKAFSGTKVTFSVTEGSVSSATVTTNSTGKASVTWTLGATAGTQTLTVTAFKANGTTALSGSPIEVSATANANLEATSIELVSGGDQSAEVESDLAEVIKVIVKDQDGNAFQGATVNFVVAEGSLSSASEVTDADGNASVTWTLGSTVGTQSLTVTALASDGTTNLTGSPITVNATATVKEAVSIELFSGEDQTGIAGSALTNNVVVLVRDANSSGFANTEVIFSVTEGNVTSPITTDASGFASTAWVLGSTEGTQTITVTAFKSDGTTELEGSPLTINATATGDAAKSLGIRSGENQTGTVGIQLQNPITLKVYSQSGGGYEGQTVYFDVSEGSVPMASGTTDADGMISTTWTLGPTVGTQTLTVTTFEPDGTTPLAGSPRLINATAEAANVTGTVTDYDGNEYPTVKIGEQIWMAENLKVTHYSDGTAIPNVMADADWNALSTTDKAYCYVDNVDDSEYGALYTRNAALNGAGSSTLDPSGIQGACPTGWHIPSQAEWTPLSYNSNSALREIGTTHWLPPNDSNNESGFTAIGSGRRQFYNGIGFEDLKENGYWWASDIYTYTGKGVIYRIGYNGGLDMGFSWSALFNSGHSIRCVKD